MFPKDLVYSRKKTKTTITRSLDRQPKQVKQWDGFIDECNGFTFQSFITAIFNLQVERFNKYELPDSQKVVHLESDVLAHFNYQVTSALDHMFRGIGLGYRF